MTQTSEARLVDIRESSSHWLVVRTKSRQEKIAAQHLRQRDVLPYCPLFQEPRWHPRAPKGPVPLFTGYVFVRCRPVWQLNAVQYCPGVWRPVVFGGELATLDEAVIAAIRRREGERGYVLVDEVEHGFRKGQRVRLMAGPLQGMEGVFRGYLRGGQRAKVLMEFLRAQSLVEVDATALAVAGR